VFLDCSYRYPWAPCIHDALRARGGALADLAIVVVDITEGFQPQTIEAIQILRNYKTPFVVAATKLDRISGWRSTENASFLRVLRARMSG
jgi:translation initiation factor 5B